MKRSAGASSSGDADRAQAVCLEEEDGHYAGLCWQKPWFIARSAFATVTHYMYACTWSDFVVAEGRAEKVDISKSLEGDQRIKALQNSGKCIFYAEAVSHVGDEIKFDWENGQAGF